MTPLHGLSLTELQFSPPFITKGLAPLRTMKSLRTIGAATQLYLQDHGFIYPCIQNPVDPPIYPADIPMRGRNYAIRAINMESGSVLAGCGRSGLRQ